MRITHPAAVRFPPRGALEKISSTCAKIPTILSTFFSHEKSGQKENCEELYIPFKINRNFFLSHIKSSRPLAQRAALCPGMRERTFPSAHFHVDVQL
jgi:hypothetical protein